MVLATYFFLVVRFDPDFRLVADLLQWLIRDKKRRYIASFSQIYFNKYAAQIHEN